MQLKRTSRKNFRKDIAKPVRGYEDGAGGGWRIWKEWIKNYETEKGMYPIEHEGT